MTRKYQSDKLNPAPLGQVVAEPTLKIAHQLGLNEQGIIPLCHALSIVPDWAPSHPYVHRLSIAEQWHGKQCLVAFFLGLHNLVVYSCINTINDCILLQRDLAELEK